jgi:hypothetical protein
MYSGTVSLNFWCNFAFVSLHREHMCQNNIKQAFLWQLSCSRSRGRIHRQRSRNSYGGKFEFMSYLQLGKVRGLFFVVDKYNFDNGRLEITSFGFRKAGAV